MSAYSDEERRIEKAEGQEFAARSEAQPHRPEPEAPAPGGMWLGNARVYEMNRRQAVDDMHRADEAGETERVAELRKRVEFYRRLRDDDQRRMQERAFFRTFNSRRRY